MATSSNEPRFVPARPCAGTIDGGAGTTVLLLRLEICPAGTAASRLRRGETNGVGEFALELPANRRPDRPWAEVAIDYVVRTAPDGPASDDLAASRSRAGSRRVRPQESSPFADRMIARYEARRFHIELTEVDVQGGGQLAGRVHLNPGKTAAGLVVTCRCLESWRTNGRSIVHNRRQPPLWRLETIWSESVPLEWRDGETWSGFRVPVPDALPPAVEARSIAWRYEVEARVGTRLGLSDTAVTTPMGFEIVAPVKPWPAGEAGGVRGRAKMAGCRPACGSRWCGARRARPPS